jgi:hypothetical protein
MSLIAASPWQNWNSVFTMPLYARNAASVGIVPTSIAERSRLSRLSGRAP